MNAFKACAKKHAVCVAVIKAQWSKRVHCELKGPPDRAHLSQFKVGGYFK